MIIIVLLMGILASVASFFLKKSTAKGLGIKYFVLNPWFYSGGVLYVLVALLNVYLLKRLPYSTVVPLGSLTYIWTMLLAHRFLGESFSRQKAVGILFIIAGVGLMATA